MGLSLSFSQSGVECSTLLLSLRVVEKVKYILYRGKHISLVGRRGWSWSSLFRRKVAAVFCQIFYTETKKNTDTYTSTCVCTCCFLSHLTYSRVIAYSLLESSVGRQRSHKYDLFNNLVVGTWM